MINTYSLNRNKSSCRRYAAVAWWDGRHKPMAARTYGALAIGYYSQRGYAACPPLTRQIRLKHRRAAKKRQSRTYSNSLWQTLLQERAAIGHLKPQKNKPSRIAATQIHPATWPTLIYESISNTRQIRLKRRIAAIMRQSRTYNNSLWQALRHERAAIGHLTPQKTNQAAERRHKYNHNRKIYETDIEYSFYISRRGGSESSAFGRNRCGTHRRATAGTAGASAFGRTLGHTLV